MKRKILFSFLPTLAVAAVATPLLTSCNKNHGQSYSSLDTNGNFTIGSNDDANNIKAKALSFLPNVSRQEITAASIEIKQSNLYWEFVYQLGNYFNTSEDGVQSIEVKECSSTNFKLTYKTNSTTDAVTTTATWLTSNVYSADDAKIYIKCISGSNLPKELTDKFISQTYINCIGK